MSAFVLLKLFILTWNVAQQKPPTDLKTLLNLPPPPGKSLPDLYVIGLQEMKYLSDDWKPAFTDVLTQYGYKSVESERLHSVSGIMIHVFVLEKHLGFVDHVESESTATGVFNTWGNKGATTVRLHLYGISTGFVNSHLAPHERGYEKRLKQLSYVEADQEFSKTEADTIFKNDLVFWFGDLNFRLHQDLNLDVEDIIDQIHQKNFDKLLEQDEINRLRKNGDFFKKLKEAEIKFPPTFKFERGKNKYFKKRRPAWTDRILYRDSASVEITPVTYTSVEEYVVSDHKPVIGEFEIRLKEVEKG